MTQTEIVFLLFSLISLVLFLFLKVLESVGVSFEISSLFTKLSALKLATTQESEIFNLGIAKVSSNIFLFDKSVRIAISSVFFFE